jgi:hypothetical protein
MAFTYYFTKLGSLNTITVLKDDIPVYERKLAASNEVMLATAKLALKNNYPGQGVENMTEKIQTVPSIASPTQISSVTNAIPNPNINTATDKDPLVNLDADKRNQLSLEQKRKLGALSPDEIKSLNKLPLGQFKSLSTDQLIKIAKTPPSPGDKTKSGEDQLNKIKELNKAKYQALKNANDPSNFLQELNKPTAASVTNKITSLVLPLLMQFVNAEKIAQALIDKLINDTKKQLKNKGRVDVINGSITFTPKDKQNYQRFKDNFDRKVSILKTIVSVLKITVDTLNTILKISQTALTAIQVYLKLIKLNFSLIETPAASIDLASSNWNKPVAANWVIDKEIKDELIKKIEDKIQEYVTMISFLQSILQVLKKLIDTIKIKLDQLNFTITSASTPSSTSSSNEAAKELSKSLNESPVATAPTEIEYDNGIRSYIIRVVKNPSGMIQAVAYDKFSLLKVTQTAPTKTLSPEKLIDELKQILG